MEGGLPAEDSHFISSSRAGCTQTVSRTAYLSGRSSLKQKYIHSNIWCFMINEKVIHPGMIVGLTLLLASTFHSPIYADALTQQGSPKKILTSITASKSVVFDDTAVIGSVTTSHNVRATSCTAGSIMAGRGLDLNDCEVEGVVAGRNATIKHSKVNGSLQAGRRLTLKDSTVSGDVQVGRQALIQRATIGGTLSVSSPELRLSETTLGGVRMVYTQQKLNNTGNGVSSSSSSTITSQNGRTLIRMSGGSSQAKVNGYEVRQSGVTTTLTTPDGTRYVNGILAENDSLESTQQRSKKPHLYIDYLEQNPDAPELDIPEWLKADADTMPETTEVSNGTPAMILELDNHSVVRGQVEFVGGTGLVRLLNGSFLEGEVINGQVVTQ